MVSDIELDLDDDDDPAFADVVRNVISGVVQVTAPLELVIVKIDNWFGNKWLGFSHKVHGAVGAWHDALRIPPFSPARVVARTFLTRRPDGLGYSRTKPRFAVHVRQTSAANDLRRVKDLAPGSALFWWSGNSARNGRGSLMAYVPTPEGHTGWHAELESDEPWRVIATTGTTPAEITTLAHAERHVGIHDGASVHFDLGFAYAEMGLRADAIAELETALELEPNHRDAARARSLLLTLSSG